MARDPALEAASPLRLAGGGVMVAFIVVTTYVAGVLIHARYWGNRVVRDEGPRSADWRKLVLKWPDSSSVPEWTENDRAEQRTLAAVFAYTWPLADGAIAIWWVWRQLAKLPGFMAKLPEAMAAPPEPEAEPEPITENTYDYRHMGPQ